MQSLIDVLIYLIIIGGAVAIIGSLVYGIIRLGGKIRRINRTADYRVIANRQYMRKRLGHV